MKYIITERQYRVISEEVNPRIKEIIFNKLLNDMKGVEIIEDNGSIWAIDPDEKYWYFELQENGTLWWRWGFFNNFFKLFSIERNEFEPLMRELVEDILNRKVVTSLLVQFLGDLMVEDILNRKVVTSHSGQIHVQSQVEDILNRKVVTSSGHDQRLTMSIKDILNRRNKITKDENF